MANKIAVSLLGLALSSPAFAETTSQVEPSLEADTSATASMPMLGNQQSGMPMRGMMHDRQAMMQEHMARMETHMANIEALLR